MATSVGSMSHPAAQPSAAAQGGCRHAVQFYERESFLSASVGAFLAEGLRVDQPAVVIATEPLQRSLVVQLAAHDLDPDHLRQSGRLTLLDADETLSRFMTAGRPDRDLFRSRIGGVFETVLGRRPRAVVRAFGEMVDVLWRDSHRAAGFRLEALWNELAESYAFSLMCGYSMDHFSNEAHAHLFRDVCRLHSHVSPADGYSDAEDEDARLREISRLQQRAVALETEVERRKALEASLRGALADREQAEAWRERILSREQLARAEAEAASRLKDEFLAVLSHELRTPLNAIVGWTAIAHRRSADEAVTRRALDVIQRNATVQLKVIDDLLDVSRILSGRMCLGSHPVDLAEILTGAVETIGPTAAAGSVHLFLEIDSCGRYVRGDADRLQQVVWNLLSNAVEFTPPQGRVTLTLDTDGGQAQIVVRDTGQGISPAFLPHVFDRFRQADGGTTRAHGGLGLGLALVRYIVEAHGGTVSAASAGEGLGAEFTVRLPLAAAPIESAAHPDRRGPLSLHRLAVLIVDDERDARELFEVVLSHAGAAVETAASADEAMAALLARPFDVIVADIGMPERDGYTLMEAVRAHPKLRGIRAVAVTSYAGDHYRARAIAAGFDEYVSKPVHPEALTRIVGEVWRR